MSFLHEVLGDIFGPMLSALEEADKLVGEAVEKLGEGMEWAGDETAALGNLIASLVPKLEGLKAKL